MKGKNFSHIYFRFIHSADDDIDMNGIFSQERVKEQDINGKNEQKACMQNDL